MNRGAWWATTHGAAKSQTQLGGFHSLTHSLTHSLGKSQSFFMTTLSAYFQNWPTELLS